MNSDQLLGLGRTLLTMTGTALGTYLVTKGYLTSEQVAALGAGLTKIGTVLVTLAPIALSIYGTLRANSQKARLSSVAAIPEVSKITLAPTPTGQALADAAGPKVTT